MLNPRPFPHFLESRVAPPRWALERAPRKERPGWIWTPGYWGPKNGGFGWTRGRWEPRRTGCVWVRAYWFEHQGRWYLREGGWVELPRRGSAS